MDAIRYGRKTYRFQAGKTVLTRLCVTEKTLPGETEHAFTRRLLEKYGHQNGTVELVFKNGQPEYAIITLE